MSREYYTNLLQRANHRALDANAPSYNDPDGKLVRELLNALHTMLTERDDLETINETDEPRGLAPAVDYWRQRWATTASNLSATLTYATELRSAAADLLRWYDSSRDQAELTALRALLQRDVNPG
jgi:hypothetical protein